MTKAIFTTAVLLFFIEFSDFPLKAESVKGPIDVIQELHKVILVAMKNSEELGYSGRFQLLAPAIKSSHRFKAIVRIILGRKWGQLNEPQKSEFLSVFTELSIATYASRFSGYSNETFIIIKEESLKPNRIAIRSKLVKPKDREFQFDYLLDRKDGEWKIINVIVDGISDLALKRAEYASEIENIGLQGLLDKLNKKVENYKNLPNFLGSDE